MSYLWVISKQWRLSGTFSNWDRWTWCGGFSFSLQKLWWFFIGLILIDLELLASRECFSNKDLMLHNVMKVAKIYPNRPYKHVWLSNLPGFQIWVGVANEWCRKRHFYPNFKQWQHFTFSSTDCIWVHINAWTWNRVLL